jgi:thiamine biosynthesis lipoprotein
MLTCETMHYRYHIPAHLFLTVILLTGSSIAHADWYKREQGIMGTVIRVELWHTDQEKANHAIQAVMNEMQRIDGLMSTYKKDSTLSRINREAAQQAVPVGRELFALISRAQYFSRLTNGAFDITFASVGRHYDYRNKIHPSDEQIREELQHIDYRHIVLDSKTHSIRFAVPGVSIDLGGIAKGHAVDMSIKLLKKLDIKHAIITAGGDSRIIGDKHGRPWMIGIRDPRKSRAVKGMIPLVNSALSTSGDYERYFVEDGEHFHHILRPDTGKSAKMLRSVTIIGPDATTTDALSTSVFVLGPLKGLELVEKLDNIEAVLIDQHNRLIYSSGLLTANGDKRQK